MIRRTVPLVAIALTLGLCASAAGKTAPALTIGETHIFTSGQLAPGAPVTCVGSGSRLTTKVPSLSPSNAYWADQPGNWGVLRTGNGLALSILLKLHNSYLVTCGLAPAPSSKALVPGGPRRL
jgi:hypothetical protein